MINTVGGGTWVPGAGGVWGGAFHQISEIAANQIFEISNTENQTMSLGDVLRGKESQIIGGDIATWENLSKTEGIRVIPIP